MLRAAALAVAGLFLLGAAPVAAELDSDRQKELLYLLKHDCGSCHGMTMKGGLGKPLEASLLAERTDADLLAVILDGMPGTPMPPWRPLLTEEEALFLIHTLRETATASR